MKKKMKNNNDSSVSMFLTMQDRYQPDVCTEHKRYYLASNISAKISFFLIYKISSILEQLYMDLDIQAYYSAAQ